MRRRVILGALWVPLLALPAAPAWAGAVVDRIKATGHIAIGYRESSVPFSYVLPDGKPVGYAIELCQRISEAIATKLAVKPLKIDYVMATAATRLPLVEDHKVDLACESTTDNAERRQRVAFTIPHYITGARVLVRADAPMRELEDFSGRRLVSTTGTAPLKTLRSANADRALKLEIGEVADHVKGVEAVERGEADGFVMDEILLQGLMAQRKEPTRLKIVGKYLTVEPLAIVMSRGDPEFKRMVDDEMRRLIRSGEARELHDRWFLKPIPPLGRSLGIPMPYLLQDFWKYPTDWAF